MSNNTLPAMVSMLARYIRIALLALSATTMLSPPVFAAANGLDTPPGVTDMPFGIQGVQVMDLTGAGLSISSTYSGTNRTANLFISSADNANQKLYFGINSNGGAASGDYASIEYLQEGQHWGSLALQADGGNVGVGTTVPAAPLEVYDPSGGRTAYFLGPSSSVNVIDVGYGGGSNQAVELGYQPSGNYGYLAVLGGSPAINLLSNGNVGIGITNPSYPLDVNGVIRATAAPNASWVGAVTASGGGGGSQAILAGQINNAYWTGVAGYASAGNGIGVYGQGGLWAGSFAGPVDITSGYLQFPDGTQQSTAASHSFGGMYGTNSGSGGCQFPDPMTGGCGCPGGFNATQALSFTDHTNSWIGLVYCWK
jgi:hypothetical protein